MTGTVLNISHGLSFFIQGRKRMIGQRDKTQRNKGDRDRKRGCNKQIWGRQDTEKDRDKETEM